MPANVYIKIPTDLSRLTDIEVIVVLIGDGETSRGVRTIKAAAAGNNIRASKYEIEHLYKTEDNNNPLFSARYVFCLSDNTPELLHLIEGLSGTPIPTATYDELRISLRAFISNSQVPPDERNRAQSILDRL